MPSLKQTPEFQIEVDGEPYVWRLQRRPHPSADPAERRGMALNVRHLEGRREAVLEFPPGPHLRLGAPQLKPEQIRPALVARAIASALAAGWEPHSRGKPVTFAVDETGA
jgi:hypothetical protein